MSAAIPLRDDFDGPSLRALAKGSRDPVQVCRLLALAEIYDGGSRSEAARLGGVGLQTGWCAGGLWISGNGSGKSSASRPRCRA